MPSKEKSKQVPDVALEERETHVSFSVADVRRGGMAFVETFDPKLKSKVLKAGGRVVRTYKTNPAGWSLEVMASLVKISVKSPRKLDLSPEERAARGARLKNSRKLQASQESVSK